MPELPEVETVCRGLTEYLPSYRITHVLLRRKGLRFPFPDSFEKQLVGRSLLKITRRAKYILFHFDKALVLIAHLGMSGRMQLQKNSPEHYLNHDHVIIEWDKKYWLIFNDARRFGLMTLTSESLLATHSLLENLGPEPLDKNWNGGALYKILQTSSAPVKSVIMDQHKLVGVGNIYACEALFRARIHPQKPAKKVRRKEASNLAKAIKAVLSEAIASGGSTLRDFVRSSGDAGHFQHHFSVYGRKAKPCTVCGNPIAIMRQAGRTTFYCKHCQI